MAVPTILFYPNKEKLSKKTNLIPIYLRIRNGKVKTEVKLHAFLSLADEEAYWDSLTQRLAKPKNKVNAILEDIQSEFDALPHTQKGKYQQLTPLEIKNLIFKTTVSTPVKVFFIDYVQDYYRNIVLASSKYGIGTRKNYNKSINHLVKFLSLKNLMKIHLAEFSHEYAAQFNDYLMSDIVSIGKKAMSKQSATSIIIKIKTILKRAFEDEKIKKNPFTGIKLVTKFPKGVRLTITEVASLYRYNFQLTPKLEIYRDRFLFQVYTGLSFMDFHLLKRSDIIISEKGYFLETSRIKTSASVRQFLVEPAISLIKKYENDVEVAIENNVLPTRHLNNYNLNLKVVASLCGIAKNLTTHVARRTTRQLLGNAGIRDIQLQNALLGWSEDKSMSSLYNEIYEEDLLAARNQFTEYLKSSL